MHMHLTLFILVRGTFVFYYEGIRQQPVCSFQAPSVLFELEVIDDQLYNIMQISVDKD